MLAPLQETARGIDIAAAMAERPRILRAIRAAGALVLSLAAVVLVLGGVPASAGRENLLTDNGTDPSAAGAAVAWQVPGTRDRPDRARRGATQVLPGADPALGPDNVVWREGERLVVADQATLAVRRRIDAPGAEEPAVSGGGSSGAPASLAATCCACST